MIAVVSAKESGAQVSRVVVEIGEVEPADCADGLAGRRAEGQEERGLKDHGALLAWPLPEV
jgi:hypothetical protein